MTTTSTGSSTNTAERSRSDGWYILGACVVGVSLSGTRAAPLIFGVLTLALIYQLSNLLEGK